MVFIGERKNMARKSIKKMEKVNGWEPGHIHRKDDIRSLDQLFGFGYSKFPTDNEEEYQKAIGVMNLADLQRECTKHQLMPLIDKRLMQERLMQQFRIYKASMSAPTRKRVVLKPTKESRDILSVCISTK
jgi:hypothetical protein